MNTPEQDILELDAVDTSAEQTDENKETDEQVAHDILSISEEIARQEEEMKKIDMPGEIAA